MLDNAMNNVFINYFLDQGYRSYDSTMMVTQLSWVHYFNGRMRFDETEYSSGSQKKQIALWVKTMLQMTINQN